MADVSEIAKFFESRNEQVVVVLPDDGAKRYYIPKTTLSTASTSFAQALSLPQQHDSLRVLNIAHCHQETFEIFLFWLCKARLPEELQFVRLHWDVCEAERAAERTAEPYVQKKAIYLWCFGEAYGISRLQNEVMRSILARMAGTYLTPSVVRLTAWKFRKGSALWIAIMKEFARECSEKRYSDKEMDEFGAIPGDLR